MSNNEMNTANSFELLQKKSMIWESARLALATLRDYASDSMDRLGFFEEDPPDGETWKAIKLSAEVSFRLLEGATDLIDTAEGDPPPYMETLFECMDESIDLPLQAESNISISPEVMELINSLDENQKKSLVRILKRHDTNALYWDGVRNGFVTREGGQDD